MPIPSDIIGLYHYDKGIAVAPLRIIGGRATQPGKPASIELDMEKVERDTVG